MNSIVNSVLSMKMDVYKQIDFQDENTGAIKKEWMYDKTLDCHAKGTIGNSSTSRSTDKQVFNNKYNIDQMIQVRTEARLTIRDKITNIRNSEGIVIWSEINFPTETPTVFEVVGVTPITDPFGRVLGYNSSMKRSENQIIGI